MIHTRDDRSALPTGKEARTMDIYMPEITMEEEEEEIGQSQTYGVC